MSTHADRLGLAGRLAGEPGRDLQGRDLQEVELLLIDGSRVRGVLHRAHGTRTLDFLNRQAEAFVAMTDAELSHVGGVDMVSFIAINKTHIVRLIEAPRSN
jgi:hypothetical protein